MHGATRCQITGQRGAKERGNDVPMHSNWWAGLSRTGVETGVQSTGALERCWGAEHYWGSRHCGGAGDAGAPYRRSAEQTGRHTGALEHRVANRPESEVVDALKRLSAGRREEPSVTEVATKEL